MRVLGIDPGLKGGMALLEVGNLPMLAVAPTIKGKGQVHDVHGMAVQIRLWDPISVYLEVVQPVYRLPGTRRVTGNGRAMQSYGIWEGLLVGMGFPYQPVTAKAWQKVMLAGISTKLDTKSRALLAAQHLFPGLDLRCSKRAKNPHEGIVDALLIAEYGRRQLSGA